MSLTKLIDSPYAWAVVGFIIGAALGVTTISVWLLAIGFGAYLFYLRAHGPAKPATEGWLFMAGPAFMIAWVLGFIVRGMVS